jgi:hypothetical protein
VQYRLKVDITSDDTMSDDGGIMDQRRRAPGGGRGTATLESPAEAPLARAARMRTLQDQVWAGVYRPPADLVAGALLEWVRDPFPNGRTLARSA